MMRRLLDFHIQALGCLAGLALCAAFACAPAWAQTPTFEKLLDISPTPLNLRNPVSGLTEGTDGIFYGVTAGSIGPDNNGALYQFEPSTGKITILHQFFANVDGLNQAVSRYDNSTLVFDDGVVCGAAQGGANNTGFVFRWAPNGGFAKLHTFPAISDRTFANTEGAYPAGGLTLSSDGFLYGVCSEGGSNGVGTIYRIGKSGSFELIYEFNKTSSGELPGIGLSEDSLGNLYGMAQYGGADGVLYKLTRDSSSSTGFDFSILHKFGGSRDAPGDPETKVLIASDGTIYGATRRGGPYRGGVIYKVDGSGFHVIYEFKRHNYAKPQGALVVTENGWIWASCPGYLHKGDHEGSGSIVAITPDGQQQYDLILSSSDGLRPIGSLLLAGDGALYGACDRGGANGVGTIFRIIP